MEGYQQYLQEKYTEAETVLLEPDIKEIPPVRELPEGTVVYYESRQYEIRKFRDDTVILYDFTAPLFHVEISRTDYEEKVWNNPFNKNMTWMKQEENDYLGDDRKAIERNQMQEGTRLWDKEDDTLKEIHVGEDALSEEESLSEAVAEIIDVQKKINFQIQG